MSSRSDLSPPLATPVVLGDGAKPFVCIGADWMSEAHTMRPLKGCRSLAEWTPSPLFLLCATDSLCQINGPRVGIFGVGIV